ncbi:MAG: extracellular solute-binding protein [Clostridia bacterium]|nr:extracellular solute-binding protein [Clostridia bacterium]
MKRIQNWLALFLAGLLLTGCELREVPGAEQIPVVPGEVDVLTHVYAPTEIRLPDGYWLYGQTKTDDGAHLVLRKSVLDPETGERTLWSMRYTLFTDGREPEAGEPFIGRGAAYTAYGDSEFWLLDGEEGYSLVQYRNGETANTFDGVDSYSVEGMFFMPDEMTADGEGNLYILAGGQLLLVKAGFSACFAMGNREQSVQSMTKDTAGTVWVTWSTMMGEVYKAPVDAENARLGEGTPISSDAVNRQFTLSSDPSEGYDWYIHGSDGIYGRNSTTGQEEMLLHYSNSGLRSTDTITLLNRDTMLVSSTDGDGKRITALYTRHADLVYDVQDIIYLYTCDSSTAFLDGAVNRFNKNHPDKRIVIKNYYMESDYQAGMDRMAMEIETGIASPDILMGDPLESGMRYMVEKGRFLDLYTLLEQDGELSRDDLFGIVKNVYSHDGKLFGLPGEMMLVSLYASRKMLTEYAGMTEAELQDGWTVEDALTLVENLPEGAAYVPRMSRAFGFTNLLSIIGYHNFVDMDAGTASFDGDTFRRILTYMASLPAERSVPEDIVGDYRAGKYAVMSTTAGMGMRDFLTEDMYFPDGDAAAVGYPSRYPNGGVFLSGTGVMLIADTCENPELAWEFLKDYVFSYTDIRTDGIMSPVKSLFREEMQSYILNQNWYCLTTGRTVIVQGQLDPDGSYRGQPGELVHMTEEDMEEIIGWLDSVGAPLYDLMVPEDIADIVEEEITAFLAGAHTTDSCAEVIQSRVEILLAERG